jgi:PhoPQ-activated pathogenicity-related protein
MIRFRSLSSATVALLVTGTVALRFAQPAAGTALDDYVAEYDPSYTYTLVGTYPQSGYTDYVVDMKSQTWLTPAEVDRTLWQHYLIVTVPDTVVGTTGLLFIGGGSNGGSAPSGNDSDLVAIAVATNSVVSYLRQVPNQPLTFTGDVPRWEDAQIAYAWDKFLRGGDPVWLSRMPMTKAAVRAMDTISAVVASEEGETVNSYVVSGASKRGWTTWTTAAVDSRVVAFAPLVIDLLNLEPSFVHHYSALGRWADAIHDYVVMDIPLWFGTRPFRDMLDLVDPYSYRQRYTRPKYLINSAGDEFFLPDSSQFYFDDLPGEKYLRYVPNTGHDLNSSAWDSLEAWYSAILTGTSRPQFSWTKESDGSLTVITSGATPSQVLLWQATNPTARDFNYSIVGPIYTSSVLAPTQPGEYHTQVAPPSAGWTAFFVELTYPSGGAHPFVFTTQVSVVPDTYPASFDPDTDGDGLPNSIDPDDDNDGEPDETDYRPLDTDDDALPNPFDDDDDGDGIPDIEEGTDDPDNDGLPNSLDTDSDGDGLPDADEGTGDPDSDGLPNYLDTDSDDDGVSDRLEAAFGTDPYDDTDTPSLPLTSWPLALLLLSGAVLIGRLKRTNR